jgi:cytochrome c-type biogenesis protein CcmH/NrfG
MESCLNCGEKLSSRANFCALCGSPRDGAVRREDPQSAPSHRGISAPRVLWMLGAFAMGVMITLALLETPRAKPAGHHAARTSRMKAPPSRIAELPPGHPSVRLPPGHPQMPSTSQVSAVVVEAGKQAAQSPGNIEVWNRYGNLAMRFAMFDPANYEKARGAFAHVLKMDPNNGDALRGIGDVYYDTRQYSDAINAYNKYLAKHQDDVRVRTDLGTMYLSQRNNAEALKQYRTALARDAKFFPAQFDLAVAYLLINDNAHARDALSRARTIAPNASARTRIDEMIAKIDERTADRDGGGGTTSNWKTSSAKTLPQ